MHRRVGIGKNIAMRFPFVSTAQYTYVELVLKKIDEIFHVRSFACPAYGDVADAYDGDIKPT
jgi:hypothetical protein